jgi:hypothetical protein
LWLCEPAFQKVHFAVDPTRADGEITHKLTGLKVLFCEWTRPDFRSLVTGKVLVFALLFRIGWRGPPLQFLFAKLFCADAEAAQAAHRVRKKLALPESAELKIYNSDFHLKQVNEVPSMRHIENVFAPGNFGILVFQLSCAGFAIPPPRKRLPVNPQLRYYLQESEEPWNDFRDFLRTNMRRIEITLDPVLPGPAIVVIIPESVTLSVAAGFFARTQALKRDDHEQPGLFVGSQIHPIGISGSKTLQSLLLPLKSALFVSMVPVGVHKDRIFRLKLYISIAEYQIPNEIQAVVCDGDRCERFFEIARRHDLVSDELRPRMRVLPQRRLISKIARFDDVIDITFPCYRIEVVPEDQREMDAERERFCQIVFNSETTDDSRWGQPHVYKLVKGETAAQLIDRIRRDFGSPRKRK